MTSLGRASALIGAGTMISRVTGLLRTIVLVLVLGAVGSQAADAFDVANKLPNSIFNLISVGLLTAVIVPQIVAAARHDDKGSAFISKLFTLGTVVLIVATGIAAILTPWLVSVQLPKGGEQAALAIAFAYWCLPQIVFYGLYTVLGEVLNARSVFGPFTWAPVLNNVIAISGIVVFIVLFGADPEGLMPVTGWTPGMIALLGGSATLGIVAQALILFVSWRKAGIRFRPDFAWRGVGLGRTAKLATWTLAMVVVMQLGGLLTNKIVSIGSGFGPSTSAMQNVWLIFMMPHSVIAVSLATAYFTRLSQWGQSGRMTEFREDLSASVRQIALVMVYASVAVFAAAPFVSRIINFRATDAQVDMFSDALMAYAVSLAAYSFLFVIQRAFYALSDTRTPFIFTTVQMAIVLALAVALPFVVEKRWIGFGFAVIWSFATLVETVLAVWLLRRKIGSFDGHRILQSVVKFVLAAIPSLVIGLLVTWLLRAAAGNDNAFIAVGFSAAVAGVTAAVYFVGLRLLRSSETADIVSTVSRKLGRNRS